MLDGLYSGDKESPVCDIAAGFGSAGWSDAVGR